MEKIKQLVERETKRITKMDPDGIIYSHRTVRYKVLRRNDTNMQPAQNVLQNKSYLL